jgi:purine-binding chemotaxis protein CheW
LADVILGVQLIPFKEVQSSLPTLTGVREVYLKGVSTEQTVILDAEKLLSNQDIIVHEQVEA